LHQHSPEDENQEDKRRPFDKSQRIKSGMKSGRVLDKKPKMGETCLKIPGEATADRLKCSSILRFFL